MSIAPISNVTTAGGSPAASPAITSKVSGGLLDREAFLKLLVTQLRYQDPSKPLDSAEMISQSAQLSVVDKLQEIADLIESTGPSNRFAVGGALIGKQITFTGPDGSPQTATATSISFDGPTMVVRAGNFDVPVDAIRSVTAVPLHASQPSQPSPPGQPGQPASPTTEEEPS